MTDIDTYRQILPGLLIKYVGREQREIIILGKDHKVVSHYKLGPKELRQLIRALN